jgi:PPK2 family polyphosphate:nucleotide phosphotransferase
MDIDTQAFRVPAGHRVDLAHWPTHVARFYKSKGHYEKTLARHVGSLAERQQLLYAHDRYALLLVFQAMDAAGKDGAIKHVMSGVNPQGCQVFSFKHPGDQALDHDFLWHATQCLPERGRIGIFNRSYYEEVLIVRLHEEILRAQSLPADTLADPALWTHRFESINDFERHLHRNGTRVIKCFLHLSREEQRKRLLARLDDPRKHWKFSRADLAERQRWPQYMSAYAACLSATSTEHAPWHVVPADDKENARLIVSQIVLNAIDALRMDWPKPVASAAQIAAFRRRLAR